MGLSPLEGLVMGTRSGDVDPAVLFHLHRVGGLSVDEIDDLLNHRSGLRGLAGDNDMRAVLRRRAAGDPAATLAFDVYCRRITEYVGAYLRGARPAGRDHVHRRRRARTPPTSGPPRWPGWTGWASRSTRSATPPTPAIGSSRPTAPGAVCVVPTDEEREIAEQVRTLLCDDGR